MPGPETATDHVATLRRQLESTADAAARLPLLRQLGEALMFPCPSEAEAVLMQAYRTALELREENEVGRACWFICEMKRGTGDVEGARLWARRLAEAAQEMKSDFLEGYHYYALATTDWSAGAYDPARQNYERCLETWRKAGYRMGEITALNGLATIAGQQGQPAEQLEMLQECMLIADEISAEKWRPWLAFLLGWPLLELGRWEEAFQTFYRALAISEEEGTVMLMSDAYLGLGEIFLHRDMPGRARAMFRRAVEAGRRRETWPELMRTGLIRTSQALLRQGNLAAAWHVLDETEAASRRAGAKTELAAVRTCQAEVACGRGLVKRADELALEAESIAREIGFPFEIGEALRVKAMVLAATGRPDDAATAFKEALARLRDTQVSHRLARVEFQLGRFLAARRDYAAATEHLQAAVRLLRRLVMVANAVESIRLLMEIELAAGSGTALLNALSALSTLRLAPGDLVEHALSFTCQATNADSGTVTAGDRVVATWERAGRRADARPDVTSDPVMFGKAVVGAVRLERDRQSCLEPTGVTVAGVTGILAVPLHRLVAQASSVPESGLRLAGVTGQSPAFQVALAAAARHALDDEPLIITGERATGRRFLARAVHDSGARAGRPFVVVVCDDVPDDLLADELFGHPADETAGVETRPGRLAAADGGTVVLYELHAGPDLQARLDDVARTGLPDVRFVVIPRGHGRPGALLDLVRGSHLAVPPLRDRREDIPELARYFVAAAADEFSRSVEGLSAAAMARLQAYDWPGNVRELQQAVERAVMLAEDRVAEVADLPPELRG